MIYQTSNYLKYKNKIIDWCPSDLKDLFKKNCKKYSNNNSLTYYKENPIKYKFNNYGFRTNDEFNDTDEGNIFLGCSNTIGIGHHLKNTWSYKLNKQVGGKFWNLGIGGTGIDTAFRLLYGFKDFLKTKNIFHCVFNFHKFRYEIFEDSKNIVNVKAYDPAYQLAPIQIYKSFFNEPLLVVSKVLSYYSKSFITNILLNENFTKFNYNKNILAIESLAKQMNCNYYRINASTIDGISLPIEKGKDIIEARDLVHLNTYQHNLIYENFLEKIG